MIKTMKSKIKISITIILISTMLSGCFFYPKAAREPYNQCKLVTRKLTLGMKTARGFNISSSSAKPEALLGALGVGVAASTATLIVSGSIVILGNTVHWLEQEGSCPKGRIRRAAEGLVDSVGDAGGWVVTTADEMIVWIVDLRQTEETIEK